MLYFNIFHSFVNHKNEFDFSIEVNFIYTTVQINNLYLTKKHDYQLIDDFLYLILFVEIDISFWLYVGSKGYVLIRILTKHVPFM